MNTLGMEGMTQVFEEWDARILTEQASWAEGGVWFSEPEIRLAMALRHRGWDFQQQVRLDKYVLDFLLPEDAVCVEVDDKDRHRRSLRDPIRTNDLWEQHGICTVRIKAAEAMWRPGVALNRIALKISELRGMRGQR
jgi:very-short-patch-repair endonuclease